MAVLSISNLTKNFGSFTAVNNLSLEVTAGQVYGILGPNGSGKTTTLGMLLGILHPTSGDFTWFGGKYSPQDARKRIGTLLETPNFYPQMNAIQNLEIVAHIKRVKNPPIDKLLEMVNLLHRKKSIFKSYSLGMKQRLAIAGAMIGDPEVLIFDEPTNGLDPQGIAEVRQIIIDIAAQGKTIIMASHILYEVEKICSHVAIIKNGNLLTTGTVGSIINSDPTVEISSSDLVKLQAVFSKHHAVKHINNNGKSLVLSLSEDLKSEDLNKFAFDNGILLSRLLPTQKSLEAEFLEITGS